MVFEDMPDHENTTTLCSETEEFFPISSGKCERLLHQHVLTGLQGGFGKGMVEPGRRCDDDGVDVLRSDEGVRGVQQLKFWI